mmetsp:Transcript_6981/g.11246  ORF Transcript_6981/g.11246 Transcript_6981/m.11246 type:complete len:256 (-) Transcript_6981:197-964(-)
MGGLISPLVFPVPDRQESASDLKSCPTLRWLQTKTAGKTPAVYFEYPGSKYVLLVTHGNAEDLGESLDSLPHLASFCNTSVFAVEYPGYSISEATAPSEKFCYEAVEAAFEHLTTELKFPAGNVIPFGRSLGSGPAVYIASTHQDIRGLVLISPLESGARAVIGKMTSTIGYFADPFKNYRKIGKVQAKTCIVHGTADCVVPCHNGRALYHELQKRGKAATPLWIEGRGHNDLPESQVWQHVKEFLIEYNFCGTT